MFVEQLVKLKNRMGADLFARAEIAGWARSHVEQASELVRDGFLRLWPHRHATDGFFAAVWQRR